MEEILAHLRTKMSNAQSGDKFGYTYYDNDSGNWERVCLYWDGEKWVKKPLGECDITPV